MRAASRASAVSMRRLNLSCMARSLLRRSAERHRITVSPVSGQRASLTSMPSRIVRQPSGAASSAANLLQLRLRRADDVAPAGLAQPRQIVGAGHAAVGDPHPPEHAVPGLHGGDDRLQGPRVVGVAGEHLVAQRKAVEGHHQRDAHLLAVGPVIAASSRAAPAGCASACAFEVGARHVVEQHLVLDRKQLAAAPRQMRFERRLVHEQHDRAPRYSRSLLTCSSSSCSRSQSAVRRYQSSAMCSSLDGSHSRAATSTAAIFAHGDALLARPAAAARTDPPRPVPRHSASARYTSPN